MKRVEELLKHVAHLSELIAIYGKSHYFDIGDLVFCLTIMLQRTIEYLELKGYEKVVDLIKEQLALTE